MANFGPKPWTNPFGKNSIFRLSQHLVFIAQKDLLSLQNTIKHIFLAYIALKKEVGKMANFGPKPGTNFFGKNSIFRLPQHLVFIAQKGLLSLQHTIKHIFLVYIALEKEDGIIANFGPKPWTNPFGKNSIFRLSQHLVFIAQKGLLSLQNTIKHILLLFIALKKEDGKMANFGPKPWTNPFGKNSIFRLSQHLVFIAQKGLLSLQNTLKHILLAYIALKKEDIKMANYGPKPWTNPFRKNSTFRLSQDLVFIAQKGVLSLQNTIKHILLAYIAVKKEDGKLANVGPKPWTNPFGKKSIFPLSQHVVLKAQKDLLSLQNTIKLIFLAYITLKKDDGKMANFRPKPWTNPFGKNSIFRLS